jgi:peptidoglycan/xylan/chitin deacetylase (PgdA/CDA1 family)
MIATYHEVTPGPSLYVYSVTESQLEEHLRAAAVPAHRLPEPLLTFDDGHASHRKYAMPALSRFDLKATFFITAGWTATKSGFMSASELRELAAAGHDVQSHGWSHAFLTNCSSADLIVELRRSKAALEDLLGKPVDAISMPGGRWNRRVLKECAAEGYRRVFTSDPFAGVRLRYGLEIRGRAMVRNSYTAQDLVALLAAEPRIWSAPRLLCAAKHAARVALGESMYQRLWSRLGSSEQKAVINNEYKEI